MSDHCFRVETDARGGYLIRIGDKKKYRAQDLQAVGYALEHYFRVPLPGYSKPSPDFWANHLAREQECGCCPFSEEKAWVS